MEPLNQHPKGNGFQNFDFKKFISGYTKHWKWFVLSVLVFLVLAYLQMRTLVPQYTAMAKIMVLDDGENETGKAAIKDLTIFSGDEAAKIDDEIQVIKSREFLRNIVDKLDLNIQYFSIGRVKDYELYSKKPFQINFIASDSLINEVGFTFYVEATSNTHFNYRLHEDDAPKPLAFGEKIDTHFGGMILTPNTNISGYTNQIIKVDIIPVERIAQSLKGRIGVYPSGESSKVLNITMDDPVEKKAIDIIGTLIDEYDTSSINKKRRQAINTANFINERVQSIASDLENVDDSIVGFKSRNRIADMASSSEQAFSSSVQNEEMIQTAKTQLSLLDYMGGALGDNPYESIPSNIGGGDAAINNMASRYNELLAQRSNYLKSAGENNAVVVELDNTLGQIRGNLLQSINNTKQTLNIQLGALQNSSRKINSKLYSAPNQERTLRSIQRKQGIIESMYIFLLEKREEAHISISSISPKIKVVESPYSLGSFIAPQPTVLIFGALFLGLFIPFGVIYVKDLLDTKIHSKEDLQQEIPNITVLGEIPNFGNKANGLVTKHDRSIMSESFRIIRTNLDFIARGRQVKTQNNVIFVTSTISGEGKSFVSLNLALTMANAGKRVLLLGADIRNPQIYKAIKRRIDTEEADIGLTEFLVDDTLGIQDAVNPYDINDVSIDIMLSGKIPPNPAELLMSDRMKVLFDTVSEQYDYVIVDTAPAMLVTDTLLISQYAGHTIYVTRAGYTEKRILNFTKELHADNKLNGMMLVVNDVQESNYGYGGNYGYYAAPQKKRWFKKGKA